MKFDKTKVYTIFNCDEVKIGSKGYFASSKNRLIDNVENNIQKNFGELVKILDINEDYSEWAFYKDNADSNWPYFYLVEEPKEKTKRPCTSEELIEMLKKQSISMLKQKNEKDNYTVNIRALTDNEITLENGDCFKGYKKLCEYYTLLDGTELWVEE